MFGSRLRPPLWIFALALASLVAGCAGEEEPDEVDFSRLVPVRGVVKVNGKTGPGLVVTFLPREWAASNGETDEAGAFELQTARRPGAFPGDYKVAVSYLVSDDGEPQGMDARGSLTPTPGMATAKEKIPPKYSSLEQTKLTRTIGPEGGTFDFDLDVEGFEFAPPPTADEPDDAPASA